MNKIILNRLTLRNFKGIKEFTLDLNGKSATITGDNATGKSTLMDAFLWLLFDKDSQGKKDFQIKTVDKDGKELHNLEHTVEAELLVNRETLTLTKTLKEKWTKKRGTITSEFSGHETEYMVDGVPVKKGEYTDAIRKIMDEETFKLLTNPAHFNTVLTWQKRRELLLKVCGDIEDADVIAQTSELAPLKVILGKRSVDDHKKAIKAKQSTINERMKEIPSRIDELDRSISAVADYDRDLIQAQIDVLDQQIEDAKSSTSDTALRQERARLQLKLQELTNKRSQSLRDANNAYASRQDGIKREINSTASIYANNLRSQDIIKGQIKSLEAQREEMLEAYKTLKAQEVTTEGTCPACGQSLPDDQLKAATEKANLAKARKLEANKKEGLALRGRLDTAKSDLEKCITATNEAKEKVETLQAELNSLQAPSSEHELDGQIATLIQGIEILTARIDTESQAAPDTTSLVANRQAEQAKIAALDAAETAKTRIKELTAEEKRLATEFEELSKQLYLCEQFTVRKVELLEDAINSKFTLAKFKMFDVQVNGGIAECCTTLVNGVPYGLGLNRGMEINVGLDIIDTLSGHYGMTAPVFVDNAEAVTKLYGFGGQMIKLYVYQGPRDIPGAGKLTVITD